MKRFISKTVHIILEHDGKRYQHVTSHVVKDITITKDSVKIVAFDGREESFNNLKDIYTSQGLIIVTFSDGSRTFLDFF